MKKIEVKVKVLSESSVGKGKHITSNPYFLRLKMGIHVKTLKCKAIYGLVWLHLQENPNTSGFNKIRVLFFHLKKNAEHSGLVCQQRPRLCLVFCSPSLEDESCLHAVKIAS